VTETTLPQASYCDPAVYRLDLERVWLAGWLFAGHSCELAEPGDYLLVEPGADSFLVVRGEDGGLRGFHNVCRHRGSRLCDRETGRLGRTIVCPYHQWSYGLDGDLRACGGVDRETGVDPAELGLLPVHVEEVGGLVFVSAAEEPPAFDAARAELEAMLAPQGLERAKVVARRRYLVRANWKLVWENNRECWHCHVGHPDYIRANYDVKSATEQTSAELAGRADDLRRLGLESDHAEIGLAPFPSPGRWWSANRTPTVPGFVTESLDGRPVAPVMGDYPGYDVGTLRVRALPGLWCHASADHAVTTRILPAGPAATRADVCWLVDAAAGPRDYTLDRLLPFWQRTSEQDWALCERNQRGVASSGYRPGPLSPSREANVIAFVEWYLGVVSDSAPARLIVPPPHA
jgi:glycine betaine catabolism A